MWDAISDKISSIFEGLIQFLFESFLGPFLGLDSVEGLIFNRPESLEGETLIWDVFTNNEYVNALGPLYTSMLTLAGFTFIIAIVLAGMRISSSGYNPIRRNEAFQFILEVLIVGFGFFYLPTLYDLLFTINSGIVRFFEAMMNPDFKVLTPSADINNFGIGEEEQLPNGSTGIIGTIFIQLILLGLSIWANFYYMMRKLTLLILLSMGPLMMVFWMIPQLKSMTGAWFKEVIGSIFVNSIHAFVFFAVSVISGSGTGLISSVILYVIFIPVSESIRGLLGLGGGMQGGLSKAGAMFGMSALAGMYGAVKGAMNGKSVASTIRGLAHGVKNKGKDFNADGNEKNGDGFEKEETFADTQASRMLKAGDIVSKGGKAVLGMAGAVAGSPLGPVAAIAGAEIGSRIGGVTGGATGRVGAAAALGVAKRIKEGKKALDEYKDSVGNEDEVMIDALANRDATNWANNNREAIMDQLRQDFPNASPQDLEKKFNDIKQQKYESYKKDASNHWKATKEYLEGTGNGETLVAASASSMANQWAMDNKAKFMSDYEKQNPRNPGESEKDYEARKQQAFIDQVDNMKERFLNDGKTYVQDHGGESGIVSRKGLASFMANKASQYQDAGNINVKELENAATMAMDHIQGASIYDNSGKPNMKLLANGIAAAKTHQEGLKYIQSRTDAGIPYEQAQAEWRNIEPNVHQRNVAEYSSLQFQESLTDRLKPIPRNTAQRLINESSAFVGGMLNTKGFSNLIDTTSAGITATKNSFVASIAQGQVITAVPKAFADGMKGATLEHISQHNGDAVQAQNAIVRGAGYATGVIFGSGGMQKTQKVLLNRLTPYTQAVQQQISSASEVIEMAQKIRDENGYEHIPRGAIKQVITRDSSYVEVRTNSGEIRTVSRIGAGNTSLKPGEKVFLDLVSDDGMNLTPASSKRGYAYYRLDSGGARIPANITSGQNPMELLGNPSHRVHASVQRKEVPVLNQKVDMGNFYIEDLKNTGMKNLQVVIDKDRQFVTAERDGVTYRVSPIMRGNANLGSNQTITIPVEINKGRLVPVHQMSDVSMQGKVDIKEQSTATTVLTQNIQLPNRQHTTRQIVEPKSQVLGNTIESKAVEYFDAELLAGVMKSKYEERAERTVQRRRTLDIVRRKQGF